MNAPSICFIIPYFGKWPFWLPLFLESCRHNPDINWLIFTDCGVPENLPKNVLIEEIGYADYCALVGEKLNIKFSPRDAYKLCDIKPALGHIHQDSLKHFDFWAWGDLDLVYGDLRAYYTPERLARHDLYSTHARRVSGHLCLIRNTERMRQAFRKIPRWEQRFADQAHHALDEGAFTRIFLWRKNFPPLLFNLAGKFNPWRRRSEFIEAYSTPNGCIAWTDRSFDFPRQWFWKQGRVTNDLDKNREFPYFHFAIWKRDTWPQHAIPCPQEIAQLAARPAWLIDEKGFHECP